MQKSITVNGNDDLGAVFVCAVRYCLGRRTYMPYLVTGFISQYLSALQTKTLMRLYRDIAEHPGSYGDNCDYQTWMRFKDAVYAELTNRDFQ